MKDQRCSFALLGPPVAWHRAKLSRSNRIDGKGVRHFKAKKDVEYQLALGMEATNAIMLWAQANGTPWDPTGEWHVDIEAHVHDLRKRDLDNVTKNVCDALCGIVYNDDQQVVGIKATKFLNRESPRTIIRVSRAYGHLEERAAEAGLGLGAR